MDPLQGWEKVGNAQRGGALDVCVPVLHRNGHLEKSCVLRTSANCAKPQNFVKQICSVCIVEVVCSWPKADRPQ
jgi:hypothetical protein